MKASIYIEDGTTQMVLTPQNDFEEAVMKMVENQDSEVTLHNGTFSECNGGYIRHYNNSSGDPKSMIITIRSKEKK